MMRPACFLPAALLLLLLLLPLPCFAAGAYLVEDGQPRADIVVAENALRTTRLAAQELQDDVAKISGARLPIVHTPGAGVSHVFIGGSRYTEPLKLKTEDLKDGACRLVSGEGWLALLGVDTEFAPIEPWCRNHADFLSGRPQSEWRSLTHSHWNLPNVLLFKDRLLLPGDTGLPDAERAAVAKKPLECWAQDERGSFNAVCAFMSKLGVRWYAPGELGEVMPSMKTIPLPKMDETVRPDFAIRRFNVRFSVHGPAMARWAMRLGARDPYGIETAHGMDTVTDNEATFAAHPDWFALQGGKRHFHTGENNHLCYSNEELINETVRYVRFLFDHFHMDMVSIMPPDGYTSICQCDLCRGKDSPEREQRGLASDYIWGFVNRVAKEVGRTHPNKKVLNCAYGIYSLPPLKIDKLEPNVVVSIVGGRQPMRNEAAQQEETRALRESWVPKTANPVIIFENYPFTDRGWYLPAFTAHSLGASIDATKGFSQGEDIWLSMPQGFEKEASLALNHFMVYFTQRMYWGGKGAAVEPMFREYVRLFYGPAEAEMNAFFDFCEENWQAMEKDKARADTALALFDKAKAKVGADAGGVYGKRLGLFDDYLKGLRNKSAQLGSLRGPVPVLRLVGKAKGKIIIDGKLDDEAWLNCPLAATVKLRELQTGRQPVCGTTAKAAWIGNDLYFAIRCDEPPGEKPHSGGAVRKDDSALWGGDAVEVLIETEAHSYYQIAISPDGTVCDLDRAAPHDKWLGWDAKAEVATCIEDGHWTAEMRLPVRADETDPLNQIAGHPPTRSLPWHVNICRQRVREDGTELSAFSPTGAADFHHPSKFATFYDGNSFEFDHGPPEDDFLEALRVASDLARTGRRAEALDAFIAAAHRPGTDVQKTHALELAARLARGLKEPELARQLIAGIPISAVRTTAMMQHLLDTGKAPEMIATYGEEDIGQWPFWKRGGGFHARGTAFFITKAGARAETDLTAALPWLADRITRDNVLLTLGQNRETNLHDDGKALEAYEGIVAGRPHLGAASEYSALQGIARIQTRRGQFDEALKTLGRADMDKLQGTWRKNIQQSIDAVVGARGKASP